MYKRTLKTIEFSTYTHMQKIDFYLAYRSKKMHETDEKSNGYIFIFISFDLSSLRLRSNQYAKREGNSVTNALININRFDVSQFLVDPFHL